MAKRPRPAAAHTPKLTYADSGVDIQAGDDFVDAIAPLVRRTHTRRVLGAFGSFAGMLRLDYNEQLFKHNYKDPVLVACTDGVGTKVRLAVDLNTHDTVGIDLVAMNVNDLIVQGAEPLLFLDYIAVHKIHQPTLVDLIKGITKGCELARCSLLGGETAEMNDLYQPGHYDLAGFAVGVVELARATDPERVEPGDVVLALASSGVHSNGYSLVRKVVAHAELNLHKPYKSLDPQRTLGQVLLEPTRIYADPIVRLQRQYRVKKVITGMAHITGGGLEGNLPRALHDHVDAHIDRSTWTPHPVFPFLQRYGNIDHDEMWKVFNMGVGYCLIVRPTFAAAIKKKLERLGETVYTIGHITKGKGNVVFTG